MRFELPPLPYAKDALEPYLGAETLEFHYEKHHRGYLTKLQKLIEGKPIAEKSLEEIVRTSDDGVFDNAAQVWNHTFYWRGMKPGGGGEPGGELRRVLEKTFGSIADLKTRLLESATAQFGTGYAWLEADAKGRVAVHAMGDALNPLIDDATPLLGIDLWEHAYYLDYRHERERYVHAFLDHLIDWDFVAEQWSNVARR